MTWHLSHRNLPLEGKIRSSRDESGGRREDMKAETVGNVMRVRERRGVKLEWKKLHLFVWLHQRSRGHGREVLPLKMQRRKDVWTDWWSLKGLTSSSRHIKASRSFSHIHTVHSRSVHPRLFQSSGSNSELSPTPWKKTKKKTHISSDSSSVSISLSSVGPTSSPNPTLCCQHLMTRRASIVLLLQQLLLLLLARV